MNEQSLFDAALERGTVAERMAFLDEACGGDVALRRRLELLLAGHDKTVGILDQPVSSSGARRRQPPDSAPITLAGRMRSGPWLPAATSCSRRSAKGAWERSGWPSRRSPSAARSR